MLTLLAIVAFGGGFSAAVLAIGVTLMSNLERIGNVLAGRHMDGFAPLSQLVRAERRIAVRRWAAASRPTAPAPLRAAA